MLTRGHMLGFVVDELSAVKEQTALRGQLGLTDLHRYVEDFVKELLNIVLGLSLVNLNEERSNAPGIDLLDGNRSVGVQVTSTATSAKINNTLEKVDGLEGDARPARLMVFIVGNKQGTYTVHDAPDGVEFSEDDIWDFTRLCQALMVLPVDRLKSAWEVVRADTVRVRVELEIPDAEGNYPTSIQSYVEQIPRAQVGNGERFYRWLAEESGESPESNREYFAPFLGDYIKQLSRVPRITREVYALLVERRDEEGRTSIHGDPLVNYERFKRICRYPDTDEELKLLSDYRLIGLPYHDDETLEVSIRSFEALVPTLISYHEQKGLPLRPVFVALDFSSLDDGE